MLHHFIYISIIKQTMVLINRRVLIIIQDKYILVRLCSKIARPCVKDGKKSKPLLLVEGTLHLARAISSVD